jgi:hypothetical protein
VGDVLCVVHDLEEDRILVLAPQMDGDSDSVGHDDKIGEDANASQEHVSVPSNDFDRAEGLRKRLDQIIDPDDRIGTIAKHFASVTRATRVPLVLLRE